LSPLRVHDDDEVEQHESAHGNDDGPTQEGKVLRYGEEAAQQNQPIANDVDAELPAVLHHVELVCGEDELGDEQH